VHRTGGEPREIIQKIVQAAKRQTEDKKDGQGRGKRSRQPQNQHEEEREDEIVSIASPVPESMAQPRENGCAATCIAMLLRKYALVSSVREGYAKVEGHRHGRGGGRLNDVGMSLEDITQTAQSLGLKARIQRGPQFLSQLEGILEAINRGATPILSIQQPGMGEQRHAVLAIRATNKGVSILDPARGEIRDLDFRSFKQLWMKEAIARGSVNEGLAFIEVWGPTPRGEIFDTPAWDMILEEFLRDRLELSHQALGRTTQAAVLIHFFDEAKDAPSP